MAERTTVGRVPIESLTGESAVIWSGWRILGDREVVREASAKGTHIKLANKFLAFRRNCSFESAKEYFDKEVQIWIDELLKKQQVYRASHILKNIGKDPIDYIRHICITSLNASLRIYLAEHMINVGGFQDEHLKAWNLIKYLALYEDRHKFKEKLSVTVSIEDVIKLPEHTKQALCTELYFHIHKPQILENTSNKLLWDYLLSNDDFNMIKSWIHLQYDVTRETEFTDIDPHLKSLFINMSVTSDMIELIETSNASSLVKELTKNLLCRYGIFTEKERNDMKLLLARIFGNAFTLKQFETILITENCNIDKSQFLKNIDKQNCLTFLTSEGFIEEADQKTVKLYNALTDMCENSADYNMIINGIFETVSYLSNDIDEYLRQNHFIVCALIFLEFYRRNSVSRDSGENGTCEKDELKEMFMNTDGIKMSHYTISYEILQNALKNIPLLDRVIKDKIEAENVTIYDLLDGYKNFNVKKFYKWRFQNEEMSHFSNETLVKKYGYKETLTYAYYLKEARPNMAIYHLKSVNGKLTNNLSSQRKSNVAYRAHIYALRNLNKRDIVCSCIAFIEMLGVNSEALRLHVTAADYIQKEFNISIGNLLEGIMSKSQDDLKLMMSYLEASFEKSLVADDILNNSTQFVDLLKTWDVIVRLAKYHNIKLPNSLLLYLARHNLWFELLLVCQIFSYPKDQVLENVKQFENVTIREHLLTCLNNPQLQKLNLNLSDDQKLRSRDTRQSLYNKIGLKDNTKISPVYDSSSSSVETNSIDSIPSTSEYSITKLEEWSPEDDIWLTILKCHHSQDPPRALVHASRITFRPIFTLLATCYEPSSSTSYCYSWIVISTGDRDIVSDYEDCLEQQIWPASRVLQLKEKLVQKGYVKTLCRAYKIFMPDSFFLPFFKFLHQCVNHGEFEECLKDLKHFKSLCLSLKCNKIINWEDTDTAYSQNLYWVATVVIRCIIAALGYHFSSTALKIKFLNTLIKCQFSKDLPVDVPNFQSLTEILKVLLHTNIKFNFIAFNCTDNIYSFNEEIERCINELTNEKKYESALEISKIAELNASEIILAQYRNEFNQCIENKNGIQSTFWRQCASDFKKYCVPSEKAAELFVEHAKKVSSDKERYEILKLTFETLKTIKTEQETIETIEMAMWKSCILAGPENIELEQDEHIFKKLKTALLSGLNNLQVSCTLTDPNEKNATETLINKLIESGKLDIALRISTIFNHKHKDLQILMLCLSLAEGEVLPTDLTPQQRVFLAETHKNKLQKYGTLRNRGLRRLSSSSSLNVSLSSTQSPSELSTGDSKAVTNYQIQMECISLLEKLYEALNHGTSVCARIILCYKLAVRLGRSYQSLLMLNDPIQFLQEVMESNISNKFDTADTVIHAYNITSDSIANFLTENITLAITRAIEDGYEDAITLWGCSLNANFHFIMELCSDVSLLGSRLLENAHKLLGHSHGEKRSISTLKTIIELLIRSHDCFTASCNMEGIASVLRKCQNLANTLQMLKLWTLLVRLVTGIGRFTEMYYVFQILKENEQFEFLLGKGLDKVSGLKIAVLEFLKRQWPDDKDLFTLVSLHFRLYYEIAQMWENEAKDIIAKLISDALKECGKYQSSLQADIKFTKTEHIQKQLHVAVTNYTHATEYYLQDNKLNLASHCCNQAQLVAVQISLFNNVSNNQQVVCILNMKSDDIDKILCQMLSVPQALIIVQAYNCHVEWANIIYNHWILNGDMKYLKDFIATKKLNSALVQDCARRYRLEKSITSSMTDRMKTLLSELKDVECKYMLASQLGFKNIVENMLDNPLIGAYLKGTVWKKGYNPT